MIIPQMLDSYSTVAHPLDRTYAGIPDDLLLDMSITVPEYVVPCITAIRITESIFFLSIEDKISRALIGVAITTSANSGMLLELDCVMDGCYGWLVLGSGVVSANMLINDIEIGLSPKVFINTTNDTVSISDITVVHNKVTVVGCLSVETDGSYINIIKEDRIIDGVTRPCFVFIRNDSAITTEELGTVFVESTATAGAVYSIAGAVPDIAGNVIIRAESPDCFISDIENSTGEITGILLNETRSLCNVPTHSILHGRCEQGITNSLPCDAIVESLHPEFLEDNCGCNEEEDEVINGL